MSKTSTLRKSKKRAARQLRQPADGAVLCSRLQAAAKLSVSVATLIRLEKAGVLNPVKLFRGCQNAAVRYRVDEIERLAGGDA